MGDHDLFIFLILNLLPTFPPVHCCVGMAHRLCLPPHMYFIFPAKYFLMSLNGVGHFIHSSGHYISPNSLSLSNACLICL